LALETQTSARRKSKRTFEEKKRGKKTADLRKKHWGSLVFLWEGRKRIGFAVLASGKKRKETSRGLWTEGGKKISAVLQGNSNVGDTLFRGKVEIEVIGASCPRETGLRERRPAQTVEDKRGTRESENLEVGAARPGRDLKGKGGPREVLLKISGGVFKRGEREDQGLWGRGRGHIRTNLSPERPLSHVKRRGGKASCRNHHGGFLLRKEGQSVNDAQEGVR